MKLLFTLILSLSIVVPVFAQEVTPEPQPDVVVVPEEQSPPVVTGDDSTVVVQVPENTTVNTTTIVSIAVVAIIALGAAAYVLKPTLVELAAQAGRNIPPEALGILVYGTDRVADLGKTFTGATPTQLDDMAVGELVELRDEVIDRIRELQKPSPPFIASENPSESIS